MTKELEHNFVTDLEKHQNIVHKVCRLYTNNQDAHNDLFQEISIQLWRAYPKFRGEAKFSTWMYRGRDKYCNYLVQKIETYRTNTRF